MITIIYLSTLKVIGTHVLKQTDIKKKSWSVFKTKGGLNIGIVCATTELQKVGFTLRATRSIVIKDLT